MNKNTIWIASTVSSAIALWGCGSSTTSALTTLPSSVNLSGTLALTNGKALLVQMRGSSPLRIEDEMALYQGPNFSPLAAVNTYTIKCTSMDNPPQTVSAAVAADGSFSIANMPATGVGCQVVDGSGNSAIITIKNPYSTDLAGNPKTQDRTRPTGDASLGTVSLNTDSGAATVTLNSGNRDALGGSISVASPVNFTGSYVFGTADFTLPPGYTNICPAGTMNCAGPSVGDTIYLVQLKGKSFTPDATCKAAVAAGTLGSSSTCSGTAGTDDKYAVLIYKDATSYASCGSKLGFTFDEAKGYGGIDFTQAAPNSTVAVNSGALNFSTSDGAGHTITEGWKFSNAASNWGVNDCGPTTINGDSAWKCHDSTNNTYAIFLNNGGCYVTSTHVPVQVTNWGAITGASNTQTALTGAYAGYYTNTTTGTYNAQSITCTNTQGFFDANGNVVAQSNFNYANVTTLLAQNALCSTVNPTTNQLALIQLQCYANAYWQNSQSVAQSSSLCLRDIRTNWGATDPANFLPSHGPAKARNEYVAELMNFVDSNTATFTMDQDDYRGVQNGQSWVNCHLDQKMTISMRKRTDGKVLVEFVTATTDLDAWNPACKAAEGTSFTVGVGKAIGLATPTP